MAVSVKLPEDAGKAIVDLFRILKLELGCELIDDQNTRLSNHFGALDAKIDQMIALLTQIEVNTRP